MFNFNPQNCHIVPAYISVDLNTAPVTGQRIPMRDFAYATFLAISSDVAAVVAYTFQRHTAVSGGTTEAWDVLETTTARLSTCWTRAAASDVAMLSLDNMTQVVATTASTVETVNGNATQVVVNFAAGDLTKNRDNNALTFTHVSVNVSDPGISSIGAGFWILSGGRYLKEANVVATP